MLMGGEDLVREFGDRGAVGGVEDRAQDLGFEEVNGLCSFLWDHTELSFVMGLCPPAGVAYSRGMGGCKRKVQSPPSGQIRGALGWRFP